LLKETPNHKPNFLLRPPLTEEGRDSGQRGVQRKGREVSRGQEGI